MPTLDLWSMLFVFMLATFVGFQVIQNVSRLLHTPLMSLTNAISAIAVVGSILIAGEQESTFTTILGTVAVAASMTNIVSGFLITDRMLRMFREKERRPQPPRRDRPWNEPPQRHRRHREENRRPQHGDGSLHAGSRRAHAGASATPCAPIERA